ncbi:MAG: YwiC-like family protein [Acidimicrobiia bacterium]|nr:YwiC-like family protein [Acidimicrobiia bacterium]NNL70469.1 YwiC-like family protein [Acidimicrobiia bacterium]
MSRPAVVDRPTVPVRSVAIPAEHGGWSLTLEPILLGLIVAPGIAGLAIGGAALLLFLARTPVRIALVDRRRQRRLPRTAVAERVATAELTAMAALGAVAVSTAAAPFWWPLAAATPLIATELAYDVRSRSRRLIPELAGSASMAAVAAMIALAGGTDHAVAAGLWCVAAARAVAAIGFVRTQLRRGKHQPSRQATSDGLQLGALGMVAGGWMLGWVSTAGLIAIAVVALVHALLVRRPVPDVPVIGAQQVVLGLAVVVAAGLGALAP